MFRSPRPACGERSDCEAIRVRGSHRAHLCSEFAEAGPSPQPSKSELRSSRPREERGEGEVIDRLRLNASRSNSLMMIHFPSWPDFVPAVRVLPAVFEPDCQNKTPVGKTSKPRSLGARGTRLQLEEREV